MISIDQKENCSGCHACANICPKQCISMVADLEGFLYPEIDEKSCVDCHLCDEICPITHRNNPSNSYIRKAYAAYHNDERTRELSSSGGIFTLLAEEIILSGGVVFGAAMSEDCHRVYHRMVDTTDELSLLQGSKYLQSEIGMTYTEVRKHLEDGRQVLFSGTPCQIEGLKSFLKKQYTNLLCVDFICHGVPSQKVWSSYVRYRENRAGASVRRTFFRHKKYGWKMYALSFEFTNDKAYKQIFFKDLFMRMFLKNVCLRPSCYSCSFKKVDRISDITLGDFWGCKNICPEMDDDKGLSLVITHSPKGEAVFIGMKNRMTVREVDIKLALSFNPAGLKSVAKPINRDKFMGNRYDIERPQSWHIYLPRQGLLIKVRFVFVKFRKFLIPN